MKMIKTYREAVFIWSCADADKNPPFHTVRRRTLQQPFGIVACVQKVSSRDAL